METAPTPRDTVLSDGPARLYRFRARAAVSGGVGLPILLVPSPINRWYILDLREGVSLARSLVDAGFDTFCLDWGVSEDEDRFLTWDDLVSRLARAVRRVKRVSGVPRIGLLGYCLGGTLCGIHTALEPDSVAALVNLAGPYDFSKAGMLGEMTDARWFDPVTIGAAGNLASHQMQSAFVMLKPTTQISKWINLVDRLHDPEMRKAFGALESWANDNVPFAGAAYGRFIRELYQQNQLVRDEHRVGGRRVLLSNITCPTLTVVAEQDHICPVGAARGLYDHCASKDRELLVVPGGHVGSVVGSRAPRELYPRVAQWFGQRIGVQPAAA